MTHRINKGKSTTKYPKVKSVTIRDKKRILHLPSPKKPQVTYRRIIRNVWGDIQRWQWMPEDTEGLALNWKLRIIAAKMRMSRHSVIAVFSLKSQLTMCHFRAVIH